MLSLLVVALVTAGSAFAGSYLYQGGWPRVGVGGMFALAAMASGALLGFLFGIPRGLQGGPAAVNTNLEQISDWLTKILVGVLLIQLASIRDGFGRLFGTVGAALGGGPEAPIAAGALLVFFGLIGFFVGYVVARAALPQMFSAFDHDQAHAAAEARVAELAAKDADALRLVMAQLDEHGSPVDLDVLQRALTEASAAVRQQVFLVAEQQRRTSWRDPATKARMTRTVPIFRLLADLEPNNHRHWGELGFALKDQTSPDRAGAVAALDMAISHRGDAVDHGWELYEFVRALARSGLVGSSPLDDANATEAAIKQDLAVALRSDWIRRAIAEAQRRMANRGEAVDFADLEIERLKPFLPKGPVAAAVS